MVSLPATVGYAKRDRDADDAWTTTPADFGDPADQAEHDLEAVCVSVSKTRRIKFGTPANFDFNPAGQSTLIGSPVDIGDIITCTRASGGYMFDAQGALQYFAEDTPMIGYDIEGNFLGLLAAHDEVVNLVQNPRAEGAVVGGSGPTGWNSGWQGTNLGIPTAIVGTGYVNGIPYVDVRFNGTATSSGAIQLHYALDMPAVDGDTITRSIYAALIDGTIPAGVTSFRLNRLFLADSGSSYLSEIQGTDVKSSLTGNLKRFSETSTLSEATVASIGHTTRIYVNNGTVVDFTLRIAMPNVTKTPIVYPPILPPAGTIAQSTLAPVYNRTDCSGFWSDTEGTVVVDWNGVYGTWMAAVTPRVFNASGVAPSHTMMFYNSDKTTGETSLGIENGGSFTAAILGNSVSGANTACIRYKISASRGSLNGATGVDNAKVGMPEDVSTLAYGNTPDDTRIWERLYITRFQHYPSDFSDAELERLAT